MITDKARAIGPFAMFVALAAPGIPIVLGAAACSSDDTSNGGPGPGDSGVTTLPDGAKVTPDGAVVPPGDDGGGETDTGGPVQIANAGRYPANVVQSPHVAI